MVAIQESMFVFDNLIMSDDKSMQIIIRVDTEDLVLALKGADEPLTEDSQLYVDTCGHRIQTRWAMVRCA